MRYRERLVQGMNPSTIGLNARIAGLALNCPTWKQQKGNLFVLSAITCSVWMITLCVHHAEQKWNWMMMNEFVDGTFAPNVAGQYV